ncbi:SurA N-terminal domain-containing protein [soil metagenome]
MSKQTGGVAGKMGIRAMRANMSHVWKNDRRMLLKSITAWILFSGIIIVFVFLGQTPHSAGVASGGTAASVNGQIVSYAEFSEQVEMLSRDPRFAQMEQFGGEFARQMVRQQAINSLIDSRLLGQKLSKMGLITPKAQLRDAIAEIPAFQEEGRFSKTRYLQYLGGTRQTAGEFEEKMRHQLASSRVARTFSAALRPLPFEADLIGRVEGKQVTVEAVSVPTETLVIADGVSTADVKTFLAKPDSAGRVKSYFDSHKAEFSQPEQAQARHILIRADKKDAASVAKAKGEAEKIVVALKGGADFAKLASEKSEDPGSKAKGGMLDFFARGAMVPEFDKYVFSAKPGVVSDPIQTDFGFHVIRVEAIKPASEKKLEDARDDIAQKLIAQERSREEVTALDKSLAAGDAAAVQAFVTKHKLSWVDSGPFPLTADSIPKVGGGDEAVSAAFRLSAAKPFAPTLVRQGPQALLIRYKSSGVEAPKSAVAKGSAVKAANETPAYKAEATASRRIDEAFASWMQEMRKTAQISINPEVTAKTASSGPVEEE